MERVHFEQEQMLAELKDFEQKGLFSQEEIKSIMQNRTRFERALVRRIPQKGDFLRYASYEMDLEALRRRRVKRMKLKESSLSVSDYALVRRQFRIFERALRKFKGDVGLWVQYIEVARREGARALAGRICARALQLHAGEPGLYVYAAQLELENQSPAAARTLLQRGIRLNGQDVRLWTEYVKFELGFMEGLRRRWTVLGVGDGDEARREILAGAVVKTVITEAVKGVYTRRTALPANGRLVLFETLDALLKTYPTEVRDELREHLHELLLATLPEDAGALRLYATRRLPETAEVNETFVERLREANETLLTGARRHGGEHAERYVEFVAEWVDRSGLERHLRLYLTASLRRERERGGWGGAGGGGDRII